MSDNMVFKDRKSQNPNRRKLKIVSQGPNEIIADIERADTNVTEPGTPINAKLLNDWNTAITTAESNASSAVSKANSAVSTANTANSVSNSAKQTATAAQNYVNALTQAPDCSQAGNVGTPSVTFADAGNGHKKFVFRNLKGAKGDKGDKGDVGAKGDIGLTGPKGEQGMPGINNAHLLNMQGTSIGDGMTQDAITRGSFARVYRSFEAVSPSFNGYTDILTLCDAMIGNSILITSMELDDSPTYPANDGNLTVIKFSPQRVVLNYTRKTYNKADCSSWYASIAGDAGNANRFSGWVMQVDTKNNQTIGGTKTFTDNVNINKTTPYLFVNNTDDEYNITPTKLLTSRVEFRDKNGVYTGAFGVFRNINKFTTTHMAVRNQDNLTCYVSLEGMPNNQFRFIPGTTVFVDLGSLTKQWKNAYAQKYYENGVALEDKYTDNPFKRPWSKGTTGSLKLAAGTYEFIKEYTSTQTENQQYTYLGIMTIRNLEGNSSVNPSLSQKGLVHTSVPPIIPGVVSYAIKVGPKDSTGMYPITIETHVLNVVLSPPTTTSNVERSTIYYRKLD